MTREGMLRELRLLLDDVGYDPAWTQPTLLYALSEGQDTFCADTGFFVDRTSFSIVTTEGVNSYPLSDRIISVLDVFGSNGRRLGKYSESDRNPTLPAGRVTTFDMNQRAPTSWQVDHETGFLTLYPTPAGEDTYQLRVWRYPLHPLCSDDIDGNGTPADPEIPRRFRWACIEWAAYKLLRYHDMEVEHPDKSAAHLAAYKSYVSDGKTSLNRLRGFDFHVGGNPLYVV